MTRCSGRWPIRRGGRSSTRSSSGRGSRSASSSGLFDMTRFGVMKHVKVLEEAGLVVTRKVGRSRLHYLNPVPIREIHDRWTGKFAARASGALLALRAGLEKGGTMAAAASRRTSTSSTSRRRRSASGMRSRSPSSRSSTTTRARSNPTGRPARSTSTPSTARRRSSARCSRRFRPSRLAMTFDARWDDEVSPDPPSRITWEIEAGRRRAVEADGRPRRLRRRDEHVRPGGRRHAVHPQRAEDAAGDR